MVPLTTIFLLLLVGIGPVSNAFSQSSGQETMRITLEQDSSPRFFECSVTPSIGALSLDGFSPEESAQTVLTDDNPSTAIMGDARFSVNFTQPIMNIPGPELSVIELAGVERFNTSFVNNTQENSIVITPPSGNETNSCNYSKNEVLLDLLDLGIPEGTSVSSINFDNLGEEESLKGADIAEINILGGVNSIGTTSMDSQTILLDGKSLPEGSFIHLYDSSPYKIINGHIAAKIPCSDNNASNVGVLIGQGPNLEPVELEFVEPLSTSGDLCLYHATIGSNDVNTITDIVLGNNSTDDIEFPETSSITVSVGSISQ
jgi:hypothetical protein